LPQSVTRLKSLLGRRGFATAVAEEAKLSREIQTLREIDLVGRISAPDGLGITSIFKPMRHRLYIHLVWTTRGRERLIDRDLARFLCRFLRAMARKERAYVLEIGLVQTHIHVLARVHPTNSISSLVKRLKGASSAIAGEEGLGKTAKLYWAKGYSVQSVSSRSLDTVRAYLRRQPAHHESEAIVGWEGDMPEYDAAGVA
jgi:putative transposase